jgi:outer membrane protein OmpU
MKKLLIASTALVATAGMAAAEVTFNGYGRFGIIYEENRTNSLAETDAVGPDGERIPVFETDEDGMMVPVYETNEFGGLVLDGDGNPVPVYEQTAGSPAEETRFESRFRLNIVGATETDNGVRFAALMRIQADDTDNFINPTEVQSGALSGARFQASAGGFRVQAGNISGVTDAAEVVNYFGIEPGLIGQIGQYSTFAPGFDAFSSRGAGVNGLSAKYEVGDFAVMASYSPDHDSNDPGNVFGVTGDFESFEIGASYTFSGWTIGGSYGDYSNDQDSADDYDFWTATLTGSLGVADVVFFLGDSDVQDDMSYGLSGSFAVGAASAITASWAGGGDVESDAYGIGFTHDLGGGVSLSGMVGQNTADNTVADLGVRFNF